MPRIPRTVGLVAPAYDTEPSLYHVLRKRSKGSGRSRGTNARGIAQRLRAAFAEEDAALARKESQ